MATRVTDAEVQAIMEEYPDDLSPFITLATLLVDEELADKDLSDARLKEIERWLAAHFATVRTPLTIQETAKVSVTYQRSSTGKLLMASQYGQQAVLLDTSGTLKSFTDPDKVGGGVMIDSMPEAWTL